MLKFCDICNFLLKFHENYCFFKPIFCENFKIAAVQKDANLVELEKFTGASRKRVAPPNTKHRSGASVIAYV